MHRLELLGLLKKYKPRFMDESGYVARAVEYIENNEDVFYRELHPAHVTGSAWVVNPSRDKVLMLHHKKLDQWFQPGGHADGESDVLGVALKETHEETGIDASHIKLVHPEIFDVDIHSIPPHGNDPAHEHIDVRFLLEVDDTIPVPGNDESHQVLWVDLFELSRYNRNRSTYRMLEKTRHLRSTLAREAG